MNSGKQITQYLEELAKALIDLQVPVPFHILIAGGAYMVLQKKRRSTLDIDFALIEFSQKRIRPNKVFPMQQSLNKRWNWLHKSTRTCPTIG